MEIPRTSHGSIPEFSWDMPWIGPCFRTASMGLPWEFRGTYMGLPWDLHGHTALEVPWGSE